jgi:hypothetical protein
MKSVQVIGWQRGFQPISFVKLLRCSGVRALSLAEAKDLVDQVLTGDPIRIYFDGNEQAEDFVRHALELGAVTSASTDAKLESLEPQVHAEIIQGHEIDVTSISADDIDLLADAWLECWQLPLSSPEREKLQWIMTLEYDLLEESPEFLWLLILAIHGKNQSPKMQAVLAAGPLEDLLGRHGADFIERVETQARVDPAFAKLLGGVWKSTIPEEVWLRVKGLRDGPW